jgi:hypothetical protein
MTALLAQDGFLPSPFANLGDRLVFANGIIALAVVTGALIIVFGGNAHALVPLFAIGAFLAFTLSQAGMVVHWWRERESGWWLHALINGIGSLATGTAVIVIGVSKFVEGAWITVVVIPIMVVGFLKIRAHFREVNQELSLRGLPPDLKPVPPSRVVVPISGVHRGSIEAIRYAQAISNNVTAIYVELEPGAGQHVSEEFKRWWPDVPLVIVPSPYRSIVQPLLDFLDETDQQHNDGQLAAVVLPEFVPAKWWQSLLHNQTAWLIKAALLYRRRRLGFQRVIIDVPHYLRC